MSDDKANEYDLAALSIPEGTSPDTEAIVRCTYGYRQEAWMAKRDRMFQNRINWDTYHQRVDHTHKKKGQSREFLPRQSLSVEQISSFFEQALIDVDDWFRLEAERGVENPKVKPEEMTILTKRQIGKNKLDEHVVDGIKMGLLGSMIIGKVHGEYVKKPVFYTTKVEDENGKIRTTLNKKEKRVWQLKLDLIRAEDWFPDPTGEGLFKLQQSEIDLWKLQELAQDPDSGYDPAVVAQISGGFDDWEQVARKARETNQNVTYSTYRKRVRLWECWGSIVDPSTGEVIQKDVTWTVANDNWLVKPPQPYPFWHGGDPFVTVPIIRTPKSEWHKALMDAPTSLNLALNESFNLLLDSGIMAVFGVKQMRPSWLVDETKVSDGIAPGSTHEVNDNCPPGQHFLEPVQTSAMSPEATNMFNLTSQEFNLSALTNDLRMGAQPQRDVKATAVVEASQSITSLFTGLVKVIEQNYLVKLLEKSWATIAQHTDDLDQEEVKSLLGEQRALELAALSPEERFAATVQGFRFRVYGISMSLNKMKDFKKLTSLMQTIAGSPQLMEEYVKKYNMGALLTEFMRSLDIDTSKLEIPPQEAAAMGAQGGAPQSQPNMQSQIAPVANMPDEGASPGGPQPAEAGGIPQANFPASIALRAEGG